MTPGDVLSGTGAPYLARRLTLDEMKDGLKSLGACCTDEQVESMFHRADLVGLANSSRPALASISNPFDHASTALVWYTE